MVTFGLYKEKALFKSDSCKNLPDLRINVPPTSHYIHWAFNRKTQITTEIWQSQEI